MPALAGEQRSIVAKVRVYELAKEFGVESKAVMAKLEEMGEFVRSASSTIEAPVVRRLKEQFAGGAQQGRQDRSGAGDARPTPPVRRDQQQGREQGSDGRRADRGPRPGQPSASTPGPVPVGQGGPAGRPAAPAEGGRAGNVPGAPNGPRPGPRPGPPRPVPSVPGSGAPASAGQDRGQGTVPSSPAGPTRAPAGPGGGTGGRPAPAPRPQFSSPAGAGTHGGQGGPVAPAASAGGA